MRDVEITFLDEYKRTDALCAEIYGEGVSAYITRMEETPYEVSRRVPGWKDDYFTLKRLRWLRNRITHDTEASECGADDVEAVKRFRSRLKEGRDPVAEAERPTSAAKNASGAEGASGSSAGSWLAALLIAAAAVVVIWLTVKSGACASIAGGLG